MRPSVTACKWEQIASMWMPSTNSVLGSRTCHACITNSFKLRLACSIFTASSRNLASFQEPFKLSEFFIAVSGVINCGFIVNSMGQFDQLRFGGETLQQCLNGPGFTLAGALPQQRSGLFGNSLLNQGGIETLLESQPASSDASRISRLSGLPAVSISSLESRLRISGLSGFEFSIIRHLIFLELACAARLWMWFERYPGWIHERY